MEDLLVLHGLQCTVRFISVGYSHWRVIIYCLDWVLMDEYLLRNRYWVI